VLRGLALAPLWTAQLFCATKSFADNRVLGSQVLNRLGLHAARVRVAHRIAAGRRRKLAALIDAADREAFERDGFAIRENLLEAGDLARLIDQVQAYRGHAREKIEGDTLLRKVTLGAAARDAIPALDSVFEHPAWRGLIAYVGATEAAPVVYVQSLFRNLGGDQRDPQTSVHADTFHPTVKAWLYLTDVDLDTGPLLYVPGSHRLTGARLAWETRMALAALESPSQDTRDGSFRVSDADLESMGLPRPRPLAVPANTLVVADTHGFHARGPAAAGAVRVEIWAIGARAPFLPPHPLTRRLEAIGRRRVPNEWTPRPEAGAFDPV
jgi:hypothetical protein